MLAGRSRRLLQKHGTVRGTGGGTRSRCIELYVVDDGRRTKAANSNHPSITVGAIYDHGERDRDVSAVLRSHVGQQRANEESVRRACWHLDTVSGPQWPPVAPSGPSIVNSGRKGTGPRARVDRVALQC